MHEDRLVVVEHLRIRIEEVLHRCHVPSLSWVPYAASPTPSLHLELSKMEQSKTV
jgi:hypothetical protein